MNATLRLVDARDRKCLGLTRIAQCAVERRVIPVGANPTQPLTLRLEAARAVYGGNDVDRSTLA